MVKTELCALWSQLETSCPQTQGFQRETTAKLLQPFPLFSLLKKGIIKRGKGDMNPENSLGIWALLFLVLSNYNLDLNLNETFL